DTAISPVTLQYNIHFLNYGIMCIVWTRRESCFVNDIQVIDIIAHIGYLVVSHPQFLKPTIQYLQLGFLPGIHPFNAQHPGSFIQYRFGTAMTDDADMNSLFAQLGNS